MFERYLPSKMVMSTNTRTTSEANTIAATAQVGTEGLVEELVSVDEVSTTAFDPPCRIPQTIPWVPDEWALARETDPPFNQQLLGGVHEKWVHAPLPRHEGPQPAPSIWTLPISPPTKSHAMAQAKLPLSTQPISLPDGGGGGGGGGGEEVM